MTMPLDAFQAGLGAMVRGEAPIGMAPPVPPDDPGLIFTRKVQRSWCEGRAANAARLTLTLLPVTERRRLTSAYVDAGGGLASFFAREAETFLAFLEARLPDPSHALTLCQMEQALNRARNAADGFNPGQLEDNALVRGGRAAALVWFRAEPKAVLDALNGGPVPPVGLPEHAMLFAPGLPDLFRPASAEEAALWDSLPRLAGAGPERAILATWLEQGVVDQIAPSRRSAATPSSPRPSQSP